MKSKNFDLPEWKLSVYFGGRRDSGYIYQLGSAEKKSLRLERVRTDVGNKTYYMSIARRERPLIPREPIRG